MGKDRNGGRRDGDGRRGPRGGGRDGSGGRPTELTQRPFGELKGMRVGPACLACGEPVDTRPGWSLAEGRGSRRSLRHGYLHENCGAEAELKYYQEEWRDLGGDRYGRVVLKSLGLEVPALSEDDIQGILRNGDRS